MISIKTRLTLFYTLSACGLFTLLVLFLYWGSMNILYQADDEFLSDSVDTIQYILKNKPYDQSSLKEAVIHFPSQPSKSIYHYFIRIMDDQRHVLIQTPGMEAILPENNLLYRIHLFPHKKQYSWYTINNKNYLLIRSPIMISSNKKQGHIEILLDISYQHSSIHDRKILALSLFIGTLIAYFLGIFIAQKGIKSLAELTETVKKITATSLHKRIEPNSWPTELRTLGASFNQMLDRIENSFTRLKQFSDDLAHELRTPLTKLMGETEISLSYASSIEEYRAVMESNLEELQRMSQLIENILFLAKVENPQLELEKEFISLHQEIEKVMEFYQPLADEKNINLSIQGEAKIGANPIMIKRIASNLLSNALNYTSQNGMIVFTLNQVDPNWVELIIRDNGIGIEAKHLPYIFNRFYRIDSARSHHSGGLGLGLAMVKSIIELHQGSISMNSQLNQGTEIKIRLPTGRAERE